jgi:probable selenium-dependent hydroxylase accessory protein YqeC
VAVVGAGGKTTLCWRLCQLLLHNNKKVIFTTTTKIFLPSVDVFDKVLIEPDLDRAMQLIMLRETDDQRSNWKSAVIVKSQIDNKQSSQNTHDGMDRARFMSVTTNKFAGFDIDSINRFSYTMPDNTYLIIEADGARGAKIKAPAQHEPVIPPCADIVFVVANLDAINHPLTEPNAFRPDIIEQITHLPQNSLLTTSAFLELLISKHGGLKSIPHGALKVAVLSSTATFDLSVDMVEKLMEVYDDVIFLRL